LAGGVLAAMVAARSADAAGVLVCWCADVKAVKATGTRVRVDVEAMSTGPLGDSKRRKRRSRMSGRRGDKCVWDLCLES
jgi:hypothetical protein